MEKTITREAALALLQQYNKEPFHIQHALTVEAAMRWFANDLGYDADADFWAMCGLLHDIDFEMYPEQHCLKAPELLRPAGVGEEMIHAICSHGHKICTDVAPEHEMEKVLFACDELTGLIGAAALMRPSKSCTDMELSSVKKKFKDKKFAAGCSREVIKDGAALLGWELDEQPIDPECDCPVCRQFSRAYLRHLFTAEEMLGMRLAVMHNLYFYNKLTERIRDSLDNGCFDAFREEYSKKLAEKI